MSCKFEYVSCRGKSPRFIIIGRNSREKLNVQTCSLMDVISLAHFRKRGRVHMILNDTSDAESSPHLAIIVKLINERHKDGKWQWSFPRGMYQTTYPKDSCSTISKIPMRLRPTARSCNTSNKLHRVAQQGSCSTHSPQP